MEMEMEYHKIKYITYVPSPLLTSVNKLILPLLFKPLKYLH